MYYFTWFLGQHYDLNIFPILHLKFKYLDKLQTREA